MLLLLPFSSPELRLLRQLLEQLALARRELVGNHDPDLRQESPLAGGRIGESDLFGATLHGLLDRDGEGRLGVAAGLRLGREPLAAEAAEPRRAAGRRPPPPAPRTAAAEQHLEEGAEPFVARATTAPREIAEVEPATAAVAEVEVDVLPARRSTAAALPGAVPGGAELVVLLALVRVLEHLVGLADLLELDLGLGVLVHVRMELARQLAVRLLDVLLGRVLLDAQRRIVVLVVQRIAPPPGNPEPSRREP